MQAATISKQVQMGVMLVTTVVIVTVVTLFSLPSQAAEKKMVYKWRDANGQVHYSERKPADVDAEAFKVKAGSPPSASGSTQTSSNSGEENRAAGSEADSPEQDPDALKDPERCKAATQNLETINNNARIRMKDPKTGEFRYLTPEEIEEKKAEAQKAIDESC